MKKPLSYAFIDAQNLYLWTKSQWRELDFWKFRIFLKDKRNVQKAFLFIGYTSWNEYLYGELQQAWYIIIFKPTLELKNGVIKGNVDAELVLHTMIQRWNYEKAVIVSGDGDFHCLVEHLEKENKLVSLCIPNRRWYSSLLRKFKQFVFYIQDNKHLFSKQNFF